MSSEKPTYRLITRSDFDGLACAVLLKKKGLINEVTFVHPKDMQDGKIEVTANDITTNRPIRRAAISVLITTTVKLCAGKGRNAAIT